MSFHSKLINTLGRVQDSRSSVSDAGNADNEGSISSAILGEYGEDGYPGSFENAIDLFEAQGLKLTRKDNTLTYRGTVPCAGGTAQVTVVLYGKRSDANSSLREAHVTSMSLFARVLTSSELPKGWIIAREEHTYRPSELPRAMQVLAMRVAKLFQSSFETDDALETAITRSFLGGRKPNITEEDRKQAKEFAESIFGRGADSVEASASRFKGRREVKDAYSQLSYAAMADAFVKYNVSYELVDNYLWASTPLWEDPVSGTKYILTFCVNPALSDPEADDLYDTVGLASYYDQMEADSIDLVIERADAGPGGVDPVKRFPDAFSPVSLSSFLNYFNGKRDYLSHLGSLDKVAVELSVMIGEFKN